MEARPLARKKPEMAPSGAPTRGPFFSSLTSGCLTGMPSTASASRRGVTNAFAPSYTRPASTSRSVTSLRKSSAARACMRAGISSENSSSSRSGIHELLVAAVAERAASGALARAKPCLLGFLSLPLDRPELRYLVRPVAEGLFLGAPAGAPPIALAGFHIDRERSTSSDLGFCAHVAPPPAVASQASPQALARSR